jgi:DNA-binding XRE family transcriptional regulator
MPYLIARSRLKSILRRKRKTQRWLADKVSIHYQRINEYANDRQEMPIVIAMNCARALDVPIEELYEWKEVSLSEWKKWIESRRKE